MRVSFLLWAIVFIINCGGTSSSSSSGDDSSDSDSSGTSSAFSSADWRLLTSYNIQAGIEFSGSSGTLTIINNNGESISTPSLFIFDTSSGDESEVSVTGDSTIADGATYTGTFTYPGGSEPSSSAYFGLSLNSITAGQFVTASAFDDLPINVQEGPVADDSSVSAALMSSANIIPTSGLWTLSILASTGDVSCVSGSAGFISSGDATLNVDCSGYSMDLLVDSSFLSFNLSSLAGGYETTSYTFPTLDDDDNVIYGDVDYTLTASSSSSMTGTLNWDNNNGCTASYPMTMELEAATSLTVNNICNSTWTFEYGSPTFICGTSTFAYATLPFAPVTLGTLTTVENAAGSPISINYAHGAGTVFLFRNGCTNNYGNMTAPQIFGTYPDASGFPVIFKMGLQGYATSDNSFTGMGLIEGLSTNPTNPYTCFVTVPFTMAAIPSC